MKDLDFETLTKIVNEIFPDAHTAGNTSINAFYVYDELEGEFMWDKDMGVHVMIRDLVKTAKTTAYEDGARHKIAEIKKVLDL